MSLLKSFLLATRTEIDIHFLLIGTYVYNWHRYYDYGMICGLNRTHTGNGLLDLVELVAAIY